MGHLTVDREDNLESKEVFRNVPELSVHTTELQSWINTFPTPLFYTVVFVHWLNHLYAT